MWRGRIGSPARFTTQEKNTQSSSNLISQVPKNGALSIFRRPFHKSSVAISVLGSFVLASIIHQRIPRTFEFQNYYSSLLYSNIPPPQFHKNSLKWYSNIRILFHLRLPHHHIPISACVGLPSQRFPPIPLTILAVELHRYTSATPSHKF